MIYNPISTYRIQFSKDFTLPDLDKIIPYLHQLGVRTIYASPLSGSVPGSEHGYDVTNPLIINPETGSLEEFRRVHQKLKSLGMGWIQDIVPNHMAFSVYNPWIQDILEKGEKSEYSDFFDIDWHHPDKQLNRKLMLPVLGKPLEEIIAAGEITLSWNKDCFVLVYHSNEFPLNYDSYFMILNLRGKKLLQKDFHRLTGLFNEAKNNLEACKKIKELVAEKYVYNKNFRDSIEENLRIINRDKNILRELIRLQYYFPAFWKETEKKLNYRRFFTINGMICLKIEKRKVFDNYHSFYAKLCYEGLFQGLRIDHIDGQFNPEEYLGRLRNLVGSEKYIIVEKILGKEEQLEKNWPVQGETGYYFMALVNNLFTNKKNLKHIEKTYQYWNKSQPDNFDEILYQKKRFILHNLMTGDLDNLYHYFMSLNLSEVKQYDPDKIKSAIGEFLINCPVYKIYNNPDYFSDQQIILLNRTFDNALKKSPDLKDELHLLKKIFSQVKTLYSNKSDEINALFRRFMQFTGPLMAKGGEDTAFYTYNRFISNNEVGNYPGCFGISVKDFHNEMIKRQKCYPLSLNATSTHDTKRGEDARVRLTVLSDIPKLWAKQVLYWRKVNRRFKIIKNDITIPSLNDEYFIYQTVVGFMPVDSYQDSDFEERLQSYMVKVLREGKVHSDWSEPNMDYEINTHSFIHSILADSSEFRKSLNPFLEKAAYLGILNSMSEVLLKCTAPGVPDFYQGSESWNFNFVDPDNRRPVDFDNLEKELAYLKKENCRISDMFSISRYSALKLLLTNILLEQRCSNHNVYEKGEYIPLIIKGRFKDMLLAYARRYNETVIILAVPLHPGEFFDNKRIAEMQAINWKDTRIDIPDFFPDEYKNLLTGRTLKVDKNISLSVLFSEIPFGLLKAHQKISERKAGILLHISSLPGKYTTGDVGPEAYRFVDFLKLNGQSYWQILPLNQTDVQYDHSPYSPLSAFAGNKCFISIDLLAEQNLISGLPENTMLATSGKADYQKSLHIKEKIIDIAYKRFKNGLLPSLTKDFAMFQEKEKYWLKDYSLFITLREKFHFSKWNEWPVLFRDHDVKTLERFSEENQYSIEKEEFSQFLFQQQWQKLKSYCNDRNIRIFGDIPIYINYDSADVWAHPEFFILKRNKDVKYVAGVPPDYFSEKGQLWNMPVFRWNKMRKDGYTWWKERLRKNLNLYDLLRLDHFRGFSAYWQVPAGEANAVNGKWVRGPGNVFFDELKKVFPDMPFVAEDLGQIDQQVYRLRDEYDLPGMRVLQFAFGEDCRDCVHFLHNHTYNSIVYTGTHDNNTIRGWFKNETGPYHRKNLKKYLGRRINYCNCHTELIRLAYSSVAKLVIIPFQDILGLGSDARMNTPSVGSGNWLWRLAADDLKPKTGNKIKELVQTFGRI